MIEAIQALERLVNGNTRFVEGRSRRLKLEDGNALRDRLLDGQQPFAVVLGCSDSRVPVELVFDQSLGDLFVIRVAGNIVAPSQIGSVEFAATEFGAKLVVVLGHTHCGAVEAVIEALRQPDASRSRNLRSIVERIRPAVEPLLGGDDDQAIAGRAVRENVRVAAETLRHGSEIIEKLVDDGDLLIVAAEYALETGVVDFFDGFPPAAG